MKKIKILVASILCGGFAYAQGPVGAPPNNPNNVNQTARSAWYKGGNAKIDLIELSVFRLKPYLLI